MFLENKTNIDLNETSEFNKYMTSNIEPSNKSYNYNILDLLENDININIEQHTIINICAYRVITTELYPFLMYLLYKNPKNDILGFPRFNYNNLINPLVYSQTILYTLLNFNNLEISNKLIFKGVLHQNNELFLFFDTTSCENQIYDVYKKNKIWYGLIYEIINQKHICNFKIDDCVTDFFMNNIDLLFLSDTNNLNYEIPIVAYSGQPENKLNFTYVFGVTKKTENAFMGPYYYFTDYNNSIKEGGWSLTNKPLIKGDKLITENEYGKYIKGGIVRFAIFLKINKIVMNHINDSYDESLIKQELLKNNFIYESLTMRISDYDSIWTQQYDSVYIGKLELDNGTFIKNYPTWVLKNYEQQFPLSYHYINKETLGEQFQENVNYLIM